MTKVFTTIVVGAMLLPGAAWAQQRLLKTVYAAPDSFTVAMEAPDRGDAPVSRLPVLPLVPARPLMSAELALQTYERHTIDQLSALGAYSDTTIIEAELPDSNQRGQYELKRAYAAPKTLKFIPVRFQGDTFVKGNVIVRVLQSEVEHVSKQQGAETAVTSQNYKFSFKSFENRDGRSMYVFHVKPRQKRPGLFKGYVYIDPYTGSLLRADGTLVKSPSWFVKKIEFVQEYSQVGVYTLPVHLRSFAKARIIGRTVVDIVHRDYEARAAAPDAIVAGGGETTLSASSSE